MPSAPLDGGKSRMTSASAVAARIIPFFRQDRLRYVWNHWGVSILHVVVIYMVLVVAYGEVRKFQGTDWTSFPLNRNTICGADGKFDQEAVPEFVRLFPQLASRLCQREMAFDKFLWVILDSVPLDLISPWLDKQSPKFFYRIRNVGDPYSRPIYTTWFTGTLSANFAGETVTIDNLMDQCRLNAKKVVDYFGPSPPTIDLLGADRFDLVDLTGNNQLSEHPFEWLYCDEAHNDCSTMGNDAKSLDERTLASLERHIARDSSAVWAVGLFDKLGHGFAEGVVAREEPSVVKVAQESYVILDSIAKWHKQHPEYLLLVSSDHGLPDGGGRIHGAFDGGNEPFLAFFHPNLADCSDSGSWIDQIDVAPTLAELWSGVNIPYFSAGMSHLPLCQGVSKDVVFWSRMRNAMQLIALSKVMDVDLSLNPLMDIWQQYGDKNEATDEMLEGLKAFILAVKMPILNRKVMPVFRMLLLGILVLVLVAVEGYLVFSHIRRLRRIDAPSPSHFLAVVGASCLPLLQIGVVQILSIEFRFRWNSTQDTFRIAFFLFLVPLYCLNLTQLLPAGRFMPASSSSTNMRVISYWLLCVSMLALVLLARDSAGFDRLLVLEDLVALGDQPNPLITLLCCAPFIIVHFLQLYQQLHDQLPLQGGEKYRWLRKVWMGYDGCLVLCLLAYQATNRLLLLSWLFFGMALFRYITAILSPSLNFQKQALFPALLLSVFASIGLNYFYACGFALIHLLNTLWLPNHIAVPPVDAGVGVEKNTQGGTGEAAIFGQLRARLWIGWTLIVLMVFMGLKQSYYSVSINHTLLQILEKNGEAQRSPLFAFLILIFEKYGDLLLTCAVVLPIGLRIIIQQQSQYSPVAHKDISSGIKLYLLLVVWLQFLLGTLAFDWAFVRTSHYEHHVVTMLADSLIAAVTLLLVLLPSISAFVVRKVQAWRAK